MSEIGKYNLSPKQEQQEEDIYAPDEFRLLPDYMNEANALMEVACSFRDENSTFKDLTIEDIREARKTRPVQTVESKYLTPKWTGRIDNDGHSTWERIIKKQPKKIARLNHLASIINECESLEEFRDAINETNKILYGRNKKNVF